jgi:hypothetical protein
LRWNKYSASKNKFHWCGTNTLRGNIN